MPDKKLAVSAHVKTQDELVNAIATLHASHMATQSQVSTITQALRSYVPGAIRVDVRTPRGTIYVSAKSGDKACAWRVTQRARIFADFELAD